MRKKVVAFLVIAALFVPLAYAAEPREAKHQAPQVAQISEVLSGWVRAVLNVLLPPTPPPQPSTAGDCGAGIDPNGSCRP